MNFQMQFYGQSRFCRYNMFNHHFFDGDVSQSVFETFMSRDDSAKRMVMVTDPPFGGLVEVLAHTAKTIATLWQQKQGKSTLALFHLSLHFYLLCPSSIVNDHKLKTYQKTTAWMLPSG